MRYQKSLEIEKRLESVLSRNEDVQAKLEQTDWDLIAHKLNATFYDVESSIPNTGLLRFLEVKGRAKGSRTVTITKNEILTGLNKPEQFILALVVLAPDSEEVRYVRVPFEKELDFKATSVNCDLAALLARAGEPA